MKFRSTTYKAFFPSLVGLTLAAAPLGGCSDVMNESNETLGHVSFSITMASDTAGVGNKAIALTITSDDGVYSHTWPDYREFSVFEDFYAGTYTAKAVLGTEGAEGYGSQCYVGTSQFSVANDELTNVGISCSLSQAKMRVVVSSALALAYPGASAMVHTVGAGYVNLQPDTEAWAYVTPGATGVMLQLPVSDGAGITLDTQMVVATEADKEYVVIIDAADERHIVVSCGAQKKELEVDEQMLATSAPVAACQGFTDDVPITLTEGMPSDTRIGISITSALPLRSLMLTAFNINDPVNGLHPESDLLSDSEPWIEQGLKIYSEGEYGYKIDFTTLLESLSARSSADISFAVQAIDVLGRASNVATLKVRIMGVEMEVIDVSDAMLGENVASVTLGVNVDEVEGSDFSLYIDDRTTPDTPQLDILSTTMHPESKSIEIRFAVPAGIAEVPVKIYYMDKFKLLVNVQRQVPKFSFATDPFATTLLAKITADTPESTSAITKYARIIVGGREMAVVYRNVEAGYLYCSGLEPATSYTVECRVLPDGYAPTTRVRTEKAQSVPDGNFEDAEPIIEYGRFPAGGAYSSSAFPIFNQQNFVDVNVMWPKKSWASINAKTFCRQAKMHNTWYMQPSSAIDYDFFASGSKSVRITSVGWSLDGQDIEPYSQDPDDYKAYNANYPTIDKVSAGCLFLGSYSFNPADCTEVYSQGVGFASRPSSLNGFFKYTPDEHDPSDRGWVEVELVNETSGGESIVIAHAYMEFSYSPDFRSFNLPITYSEYFTPATKLKIFFCSSIYSSGAVLSNPQVPVSADIPNSCYRGSELWIDNLSFSY